MVPRHGFIEWLFETWSWLVHNHDADLRARHLVLPTHEHFPIDTRLRGTDLAEDYFLFVHEHAGLVDWPLHVLTNDEFLNGANEADEGFPIPYERTLVSEPAQLVTTFARGVSHYVVQSICTPPPGDAEYVVDLTAVSLGFGVFCANAAAPHQRSNFYLRSQSVGAMAEHEFAYALAVFGILLEIPDRQLERYLRPNPRVFHRKAVKHVLRHYALGLDRLRGTYPYAIGPYR